MSARWKKSAFYCGNLWFTEAHMRDLPDFLRREVTEFSLVKHSGKYPKVLLTKK